MPVEEPTRRQRVAAYAVVVREGHVLLSKLAPYLSMAGHWTLPGGGVEHGEHPADAVVREVAEETGLDITITDRAWVDSLRRVVDRDPEHLGTDQHSIRIVYEGWVPADAPAPRVVEVDGSTVEAAWVPLADVLEGRVPVVSLVSFGLEQHATARMQRVAAKAVVRRGDSVLLTRNSATSPKPGTWTLPGGGVDHGEAPADTVVREVAEETGLTATVERLLGVHDEHFTGTAPHGREEDFHAVHLLYAASVGPGEPVVTERGGTTDAAAWVPVADVLEGRVPVTEVVTAGLAMGPPD